MSTFCVCFVQVFLVEWFWSKSRTTAFISLKVALIHGASFLATCNRLPSSYLILKIEIAAVS